MFTIAGSSSIYATNRLDRCFHDAHTTISHAVGAINGLTVTGRALVGLPMA